MKHGELAGGMLWNPAEFKNHDTPTLALRDSELLAVCDAYRRMLAARRAFGEVRGALCQVASELATADWSGRLAVTPDFVVFAVDFEGVDLAENLKASVPAEQNHAG